MFFCFYHSSHLLLNESKDRQFLDGLGEFRNQSCDAGAVFLQLGNQETSQVCKGKLSMNLQNLL